MMAIWLHANQPHLSYLLSVFMTAVVFLVGGQLGKAHEQGEFSTLSFSIVDPRGFSEVNGALMPRCECRFGL